jgi:hypothetical protein
MTIFVLFLEFTAGELLAPFCRSAFQARIAAESRSYGKNFCNDRVYSAVIRTKDSSSAPKAATSSSSLVL